MRFSSIVLGLAAAVSAIDIRGHDQDICRGGYVACVNIDPNVCCTFDGKASIWVAAVRDVPSLLNPSPLLQFPIYKKAPKRKRKKDLTCRNESTQIPPAWRIRARSMTGGGCSYLATEGDNNGTQDICLAYTSRGLRTGARYWFLNLKRAEDETCPAAQPEGGKCEASVKPNVLGLADGTEYNIEGLSDEKVAEMVSSLFFRFWGSRGLGLFVARGGKEGALHPDQGNGRVDLNADLLAHLQEKIMATGAGADAMPAEFHILRRSIEV